MIPVETNGLIKASEEAAETTEDTNAAADAAVFPTFPAMGTVDTDPVQEGNQYRERCKDLLGNNICSIFTFTVTNPSESASQQIYGYLTVSKNEFANLKYAVYKGTPDQITTWTVNGDDPEADDNGNFQLDLGDVVQHVQAVPTNPVSTAGEANDIPGMTVTLPPEGEVTYTVLLWIEETGQDQTETDSKIDDGGTTRGRAFEGGILVNTSGGGSGVTGTLRLA